MTITTIIFDLDGTLINSAPSILGCLEAVIAGAGLRIVTPLHDSLIGPPLRETIQKITGLEDLVRIESLVSDFKLHYDNLGYQQSIPYSGVDEILDSFKKNGYTLALATNKRIIPTLKILEHLNLRNYFESVYTIDMNTGAPFSSKSAMLARLISDKNLESTSSIYIGDRLEDQLAAHENSLFSITVGWGYGDYRDPSIYSALVSSPDALQTRIASYQ